MKIKAEGARLNANVPCECRESIATLIYSKYRITTPRTPVTRRHVLVFGGASKIW